MTAAGITLDNCSVVACGAYNEATHCDAETAAGDSFCTLCAMSLALQDTLFPHFYSCRFPHACWLAGRLSLACSMCTMAGLYQLCVYMNAQMHVQTRILVRHESDCD